MNRALAIRASALYLPIAFALIAGLLQRGRSRQFAACLLSFLWTLPALLAIQMFNLAAHWWSFTYTGVFFRAMPLELYLGWAVLWGLLPQLAFPRLPIAISGAIMLIVDLVAMPACAPVVQLGPRWLAGEAVAVAFVLIPALCIARWTLEDTHLQLRAFFQIATAGMIFLFLLPEIAFALRPSIGWAPLLQLSSWARQLALQAVALLAVPGVSAVFEFAERGDGTPIPYDPPQHLVTSGIYRYVANPMQLSCGLVMSAWSLLLANTWIAAAAAIAFIYSAGLAEWDERDDLERRFGSAWHDYRASVRNWIPRGRPYHAGANAQLYIASTCGPCSELRRWIEARDPIGLDLVPAETLPPGCILRLRYVPAGGAFTEGVRAFARVLEHLNFGWALAGATLRLPVVWHIVQVFMDASGLGPRTLASTEYFPARSSTSASPACAPSPLHPPAASWRRRQCRP